MVLLVLLVLLVLPLLLVLLVLVVLLLMLLLLLTGTSTEHSIFYYNCRRGSSVSFDLDIALYNKYGSRKDYLSAGDSPLPTVWFCFALLFGGGAVWWLQTCKAAAEHVHSIHKLMSVLVHKEPFCTFRK